MQDFQLAHAAKRTDIGLFSQKADVSHPVLTWALDLCQARCAVWIGTSGLVDQAGEGVAALVHNLQLDSNPADSRISYRFDHKDQAWESFSLPIDERQVIHLFRPVVSDVKWDLPTPLQKLLRYSLQKSLDEDAALAVDLDELPLAAVLLRPDGTILRANATLASLLGYEAPLLSGANLVNFTPSGKKLPHSLRESIDIEDLLQNGVAEMVRAGGEEFPVFQQVRKISGKSGNEPTFVLQVVDLSALHQETAQLKKTIKEQQAAIFDSDHRLKSNLQLICSLLDIEARAFEDPWLRALFAKSRQRVMIMALLNRHIIHINNNKSVVRFSDYTKALAQMVASEKNGHHRQIELKLEMGKEVLLPEKVLYSGLIVQELLSNAYDHAFPETGRGIIKIQTILDLKKHTYKLRISDNGIGLSDDEAPFKPVTTGFKLIQILLRQLQGKMSYLYDNGSVFEIELNLTKTEVKQSKIIN